MDKLQRTRFTQDGVQIFRESLKVESVFVGSIFPNIFESYLFGGVGYGPDIASNKTDSDETEYIATLQTFQNSYNPDVAPRDKRHLKNLEDSNFRDLDAFVTSECGKFSQELESKQT